MAALFFASKSNMNRSQEISEPTEAHSSLAND